MKTSDWCNGSKQTNVLCVVNTTNTSAQWERPKIIDVTVTRCFTAIAIKEEKCNVAAEGKFCAMLLDICEEVFVFLSAYQIKKTKNVYQDWTVEVVPNGLISYWELCIGTYIYKHMFSEVMIINDMKLLNMLAFWVFNSFTLHCKPIKHLNNQQLVCWFISS